MIYLSFFGKSSIVISYQFRNFFLTTPLDIHKSSHQIDRCTMHNSGKASLRSYLRLNVKTTANALALRQWISLKIKAYVSLWFTVHSFENQPLLYLTIFAIFSFPRIFTLTRIVSQLIDANSIIHARGACAVICVWM